MNGARPNTGKIEPHPKHFTTRVTKSVKLKKKRRQMSEGEKLKKFRKDLSESLRHIGADANNAKDNRDVLNNHDTIPKILLDKSLSAKERRFKKKLWDFYKNYHVDMSNFKFNREEIYDRP